MAGANVVIIGQGVPERAAAYAERYRLPPCPIGRRDPSGDRRQVTCTTCEAGGALPLGTARQRRDQLILVSTGHFSEVAHVQSRLEAGATLRTTRDSWKAVSLSTHRP